jgi:metabolite-proton symporter
MTSSSPTKNSTRRVLIASLAGTTIEFFDFYIYATAAVLVFPKLFFPTSNPTTATLESLATFALAFIARPFGAALFGHFGDKIGRKATLVAALLTMGCSTFLIGLLPGYQSIGIWAPIMLAVLRFGQGLGLGGEWGGAVLLATENAPEGKKARFGMFPQLGAPLGFICSSGIFLILGKLLTEEQFQDYGWRIPFISSAILVAVGLYVRLKLIETPAFLEAVEKKERVKFPILKLFSNHTKVLTLGTFACVTAFLCFYLMTVFSLSWGTSAMKYARQGYLLTQISSMLFFTLGIIISAVLADKYERVQVWMFATTVVIVFGFFIPYLFVAGNWPSIIVFHYIGLMLMGLSYGLIGTALAELFPTNVRYTGASLAFTLAGILGGSLTPFIATMLAKNYGINYVGYFLSATASISLIALVLARNDMKENKVVEIKL